MEQLFSPWRMQYIQNNEPVSGCVFCQAAEQVDSEQNLIIARGELAFVILNRYPYTSGHLMVVPFAHEPTFELLNPATRSEIMELCTRGLAALRQTYNPQGFNVGVNIGAAGGAGIAAHVHFHLVPRWIGDSNFMSSVAHTRVVPEELEVTYARLRNAWNSLS